MKINFLIHFKVGKCLARNNYENYVIRLSLNFVEKGCFKNSILHNQCKYYARIFLTNYIFNSNNDGIMNKYEILLEDERVS